MTATIIIGDCVEQMAAMPEASVDSVVCDPPYGIRFMGKAWDGADIEAAARRDLEMRKPEASTENKKFRRGDNGFGDRAAQAGSYDFRASANQAFQAWCSEWAREALRVLKPGGHLLAFGGTRTVHRLTSGLEDAGFEIRDSISWVYGSG